MNYFLSSPISATLIGAEWPALNFSPLPGLNNDWNVPGSGFGGEIPNRVTTAWEITTGGLRRHRYEYQLSSLVGNCTDNVDAGPWGNSQQAGTHVDFDYRSWGWQILDALAFSHSSVGGYCQTYGLVPGAFPQEIKHRVTLPIGYRCYKHDQQYLSGVWIDIGGLQELEPYTFNLAMELAFTVLDGRSNPRVIRELSFCSVSPLDRVYQTDPVGFRIVLEKRALSNDWPTDLAYLACVCNGRVRAIWAGSFAAGSPETTRVELNFSLTPEEMMQGSVSTPTPIVVYFHAGDGVGFDPSTSRDSVSYPLQVWVDVPVDNGRIVVGSQPDGASFTLKGPASYSGIAPKTFNLVPAGDYTITWAPRPGYTTPKSEKKTLPKDGVISFNGIYGYGGDGDEEKSLLLPVAAGATAILLGLLAYAKRRK